MLNSNHVYVNVDAEVGYSIIIPVKEINDYIHESIPITLKMDYEEFEIIILPNELPDMGTLPSYLKDPKVRIVPSGRVSPAVKRDLGAEVSRYERLAFLDDDAFPEADWLKMADLAFEKTRAAAIGGPGMTPANSSLAEQTSGLFYETYIGGGGMDFRYRPATKGFFVDDFPTVNLIVEKEAFNAVQGFDNEFWPGEDTKFCLDLIEAGYKIWYEPSVLVWHHRRTELAGHLKQVGNYGKHRGYFAKKFPGNSRKLVYFVPSIFLIGNIGLAMLSLMTPKFLDLWGALLAVYFILATFDVFSRTRNFSLGMMTVGTIFFSHLYYGFNFLRGLMTSKGFVSQLR